MQKRIKRIFPRYMWKIAVSTAVFVLLFGISTCYYSSRQIEQDLENNLNYCLSYFNSFFDGMAYANYSLVLDPTVSGVMASPLTVDPYDYKTTLDSCKKLQAQLSSAGVTSIYLFQDQSEIVFATGTGKVDLRDFRDGAFLQEMKLRSIPSVTQRSMAGENIVTFSTRYSSDRSTRSYGYLCFNIRSAYLESQLANLLRKGYTVSLSTGSGAKDMVTLGQTEGGAVFSAAAPLNSYYINLRVSYPQSRFWQEFFFSFLTQCGLMLAVIFIICSVFFWTFRSFQNSFRPMLLSLANSCPQDEPDRKLTLDDLRKSFDQLVDDRRSYREQLQEARRWAEEKGVGDLLQGNILKEEDFAALCPAFPTGEQGAYLVACVQMTEEHPQPQEEALARALVRSIFSQKGPSERFSQAVDVDFESIGLVVEYEEEFAEEVRENLQRKIESAKKSLPQHLAESLFVSAVLPVRQFAQISPAYRRAKANLIHRYILVGTPFIFTDMSGPDPENLMSPAEINQIASAVNMDRLDLVADSLRKIAGNGGELSSEEWYKLKSKAILAVGVIFNQAFLSVEASRWQGLYQQAQRLVNAESPAALQAELQRLTEMISQETFSGFTRSESGSRYVRQAYQYMKEHYDQELNVSDIAEALSVNVKYLSRLFKQESGQTMTQYIAGLRLKKAVSLLEGTDLPIYKVGAQVGFHDVRGFIRLFKKEYGMTPNEYRAGRPLEKA